MCITLPRSSLGACAEVFRGAWRTKSSWTGCVPAGEVGQSQEERASVTGLQEQGGGLKVDVGLLMNSNQAPSAGEEGGLCCDCCGNWAGGGSLVGTSLSRQGLDRGMHSCSLLSYLDHRSFVRVLWFEQNGKRLFKIKCKQTDG